MLSRVGCKIILAGMTMLLAAAVMAPALRALAPPSHYSQKDHRVLIRALEVMNNDFTPYIAGQFNALQWNSVEIGILRLYWLICFTRSESQEVRSRVLKYFYAAGKVKPALQKIIESNFDSAPQEALNALAGSVRHGTLAGAEKIYAIWLKRYGIQTQWDTVAREELQRAMREGKISLVAGKNKVPLAVFLVVPPGDDLNFLEEAGHRVDEAFVQSYASRRALSAAQEDLQTMVHDAQLHGKARLQPLRYLDYVAQLEADEILLHLPPLPEQGAVLQLNAGAGAMMRQWRRLYPDAAGPCIASDNDGRLTREAWEISRRELPAAMNIRIVRTDAAALSAQREDSVNILFANGLVGKLHERWSEMEGAQGENMKPRIWSERVKKILEAFAEMHRVLPQGGYLYLMDDGTTPQFAYHLLAQTKNYRLLHAQAMPGMLGGGERMLLCFEKVRVSNDSHFRNLLQGNSHLWPACIRTGQSLGAARAKRRETIQQALGAIPAPDIIFPSYHFPRHLRMPMQDALINEIKGWGFSFDQALRIVNTVSTADYLWDKVPGQPVRLRDCLIRSLGEAMPNKWIGDKMDSDRAGKLQQSFQLYRALDEILAGRQDILRSALEVLENAGHAKFRQWKRDFENMYLDGQAIPGRLLFVRMLLGTILFERYVYGNDLMLLKPEGRYERVARDIRRHSYRLDDLMEFMLDKCMRELRVDAMALVYHSQLGAAFLRNMGVKDEEIIEARDSKLVETLLLLRHARGLGYAEDAMAERQEKEVLEAVAGKPVAGILLDHNLDTYRQDAAYEILFRAYLCYGTTDAHLWNRLVDHADKFWARGKTPISILLQSLGDKNERMRDTAVRVLGKLQRKGVTPALIKALRSSKDNGLKVRIIRVLGNLQDQQAIGVLNDFSKDGSPWVRQQVANALGALGGPRAQQLLLKLSADPHPSVRDIAQDHLPQQSL